MKDHDVLKFEMLTSEWHIPTNEAFITVCIKVFTNTEDDVPKEIRINKFFTCRDFVYYVAGLFNLERFYHGDITLSCDAIAGGDDMMWHDHDILDVMDGGWKLEELGVKGGHTLNIKFGGRGGTVKRRVIAISERQAKEDDIPLQGDLLFGQVPRHSLDDSLKCRWISSRPTPNTLTTARPSRTKSTPRSGGSTSLSPCLGKNKAPPR